MNQNTTILVCCHKQDFYHQEEGLIPIHVGKALANIDLGMIGDNSGDNISSLNPNFCELTAHYWLWKNGERKKYVGLNHYRRYFDFKKKYGYGSMCNYITEQELEKRSYILPNIDEIMKNIDIILPTAYLHPLTLKDNYCYNHIKEDYNLLQDVIQNLYPDYIGSFKHIMEKNNSIHLYNMFITRWEIFDNYSEWLFNILFEVQKHIKISPYFQQARVFGYMAERLLNVYVHHHKFKIKEVPVMMISNKQSPSIIKMLLRWTKNKILSKLVRIS